MGSGEWLFRVASRNMAAGQADPKIRKTVIQDLATSCGVELMEVLYESLGFDTVRARNTVMNALAWLKQDRPEVVPQVLEATLRHADGELDLEWKEAFEGVPRKPVIRREPGVRRAFVEAASSLEMDASAATPL